MRRRRKNPGYANNRGREQSTLDTLTIEPHSRTDGKRPSVTRLPGFHNRKRDLFMVSVVTPTSSPTQDSSDLVQAAK